MASDPKHDDAVTDEAETTVKGGVGAGKVPAEQLRMKDFIERVTQANGGKRTGVRQLVELTLAALGEALEKGEQINLAPFGRAKVTRRDDAPDGASLTIRLRRTEPGARKKSGEEGVAETVEAS